MSKEEKDLELNLEETATDEGMPTEEAKPKRAKKAPAKKDTPQELTMAELQKQHKVLDMQGKIKVNIGEAEYNITYDKVFRKTKQQAVVEDMLEFFMSASEDENRLKMSQIYPLLLIIKHFTSLDVPEDIASALILLEILIDLEVITTIMNELPEDQVTNLFEVLTKSVEVLNDTVNESAKKVQDKEDKKLRLVKDDDTED